MRCPAWLRIARRVLLPADAAAVAAAAAEKPAAHEHKFRGVKFVEETVTLHPYLGGTGLPEPSIRVWLECPCGERSATTELRTTLAESRWRHRGEDLATEQPGTSAVPDVFRQGFEAEQ